MSSRCHLFFISLTLIALSAIASAASSSISTTTAPPTSTASTSTTVSIFPGTSAWVYYGCYNETVPLNNSGNLRALQGATESLDNMTVGTCLSFCGSDTFAGLKYARFVAHPIPFPLCLRNLIFGCLCVLFFEFIFLGHEDARLKSMLADN